MEQNVKTTHHGAQKIAAAFPQNKAGHDKVKKSEKDMRSK